VSLKFCDFGRSRQVVSVENVLRQSRSRGVDQSLQLVKIDLGNGLELLGQLRPFDVSSQVR